MPLAHDIQFVGDELVVRHDNPLTDYKIIMKSRKARVANTPAESAALSLLEGDDTIEDLIKMVSDAGVLMDPVSRQMVKPVDVIEALERIRPGNEPVVNGITVYHATTPQYAVEFLRRGFIPETKPVNLTDSYAPGKGIDVGLYVGSTPGNVESYGRVILEVTVPKEALEVPAEQSQLGETDPLKALATHDGAIVMKRLPPSSFKVVEGERYITGKVALNHIADKFCDPFATSMGWIDPRGKLHRIAPPTSHEKWAELETGLKGEAAQNELLKKGWIRAINKVTYEPWSLDTPPATAWKKARELASDCVQEQAVQIQAWRDLKVKSFNIEKFISKGQFVEWRLPPHLDWKKKLYGVVATNHLASIKRI